MIKSLWTSLAVAAVVLLSASTATGDLFVIDTFEVGTVNLSAGIHSLDLVFFERGGGAEVELFAAKGTFTAFSGDFKLVGDTAAGGLAAQSASNAFYPDLIDLNLEGQMYNVNSGSYSRIAFDVTDSSAVSLLSLRMKYDDGFVAYINGNEVARINVTGSPPLFDDKADASLGNVDNSSRQGEWIISAAKTYLTPGPNTLAIQLADKAQGPVELYYVSDFQRKNWASIHFRGLPGEARLFFVPATDNDQRLPDIGPCMP